MKKLNLNENFICRIWEKSSYYSGLKSIDGKNIEVLSTGEKNKDHGPDYRDAFVRIDGHLFSGDVEIHKSFSDWYAHKHQKEGKYNKVVLHIVFWETEKDKESKILAKNSRVIPTVFLSKHLTNSIHNIWKEIIDNPSKEFRLPCHEKAGNILQTKKIEFFETVGLKRLNYRTARIKQRLEELTEEGYDIKKKPVWEKILFEFICEALGFSKNKSQFLKLARLIPIDKITNRYSGLTDLDAIIFGAAGFLQEINIEDEYVDKIKTLKAKYFRSLGIDSMDKAEWNFFRLRPQNFPTRRLAYASGVLAKIINNNFFKEIILAFEEENTIKRINELFLDIDISLYWKSHFNFGKANPGIKNTIGDERIKDIIINVVFPFVLLYSVSFNNSSLKNNIKNLYLTSKASSRNEITKVMESQLGVKSKTTAVQQGLIHLHNFSCVKGKCDECLIGSNVFVNEGKVDYLQIILY